MAWARIRQRRIRFPVRSPYANLRAPIRILALLILPLMLLAFGLIYGFYFALTAPYLIMAFAAPVGALFGICIWALPERTSVPTRTIEFCFAATLITIVLWPRYLAIHLPGMPWITMLRLFGFPFSILLAVALSTSRAFRIELGRVTNSTPMLMTIFIVFTLVQFISMGVSSNPAGDVQILINHVVNWTSFFLFAAWLGARPGRARFYIDLLLAAIVPVAIIAFIEYQQKGVLWRSNIPSFMRIDDPFVWTMLSSITRSASGLYRAKATFTQPLLLAEFMGLLTPFLIHRVVFGRNRTERLQGLILLPIIFIVTRMTDSRLGVNSFVMSFAFYLLLWGLVRFHRARQNLFSGAVVYAYPGLLGAVFIAVEAIPPLHSLLLGGAAQAASNAARQHQLVLGFPKMLSHPLGFGASGAGRAMGYGSGEFIAVDNYYLVAGLSYGVMGITTFVALFLAGSYYMAKEIILAKVDKDDELMLLMPLAVVNGVFLIEKWVFGQDDNHPIMFALVGLGIGLVFRAKRRRAAT